MRNDYFRYYYPNYLIPLLVFLGLGFYFGNHFFNSHWGVSLSIISMVSTLLILIDRKLWRYKPFSFLFWSIDLSGRYEGEIIYKDIESNKEVSKKAVIEISQTGSSIKIHSFFGDKGKNENSISKSLHTSLIKDDHDEYSIVFTYQNDGNLKLNFSPHYGTNIFRVIKPKGKDIVLEGKYYTDRLPNQTKGIIRVEFKSKKINQE